MTAIFVTNFEQNNHDYQMIIIVQHHENVFID